jgi:alpha-tubulin suppressor-like RCC1 family protein
VFSQVAAGLGHSVVFCRDGHLYSWGWNAGNQLGLGHIETSQVVALPSKLELPLRGHHLAAGRAHSLLTSSELNPETYAWGSGRDGRLGLGSQQGSDCPETVPALERRPVLGVACGMDHSILLVN